jgi:tetratricopeptide (TPR) repeat protein
MRIAAILVFACLAMAQAPAPEQLFRDAVAAQQRGDDPTAIRKYRELLKMRPDVMEARANLGAVLARDGRFDEAIEQYRAALQRDPKNPAILYNLALAFYKKGAFAEAVKPLEALRAAEPSNARVAELAGECFTRLGQDDKAIEILRPLLAAHPEDLGAAWLLGSALVRTAQKREGLPLLERIGKEANNADAYLLAGQTALKMNEFERARDNAAAALRINPKIPGGLTLRGMVLPYLGDNAGAIAALEQALALNPGDFDANLNLGAVLHTERRLDEARSRLERAMKLQPDSNLARYEMARLQRTEGKIDAAIAGLEKVIQADPAWAQPHIELSALYFRVDRRADGERERAAFDKLNAQQQR